MMTVKNITAGSDTSYYIDDDYYMKSVDLKNDKWMGKLADKIRLKNNISLESYSAMQNSLIRDYGRSDLTGVDLTFSSPKSVSVMLAKDEKTRNIILSCHDKAVNQTLEIIENEYIQTVIGHSKKVNTGNMIAARFRHLLAREDDKENIDLHLHTHVNVMNLTTYKGKEYAVNYKKIIDNVKELGFTYRRLLADELQKNGYELELYDTKEGYFRIKGFSEELERQNSHRRQQILYYIEKNELEYNSKTAQIANLATRKDKKYEIDVNDVFSATHNNVFQKNDINFGGIENEYFRQQESESDIIASGSDEGRDGGSEANVSKQDIEFVRESAGSGFEEFKRINSLSDMSFGNLAQTKNRADVLLPSPSIINMAEQQTIRSRNFFVQQQRAAVRNSEIKIIADEAIADLLDSNFAITVKAAKSKIMRHGMLWNITDREALKLIERNSTLVKLGKLQKNSKDVYLTTAEKLKQNDYILNSVERCSSTSTEAISIEASSDMLQYVINKKNEELGKVRNPSEEQAALIHHVLTNKSNLVFCQGLAGTGKTFAVEYLKGCCDELGIDIKGACFTGKAADGLQSDSGITSTTIHGFLNRAEKESGIKSNITEGNIKQSWDFSKIQKAEKAEIIIVDEAGLVDNTLMYQLLQYQEARGDKCKLVLSGDYDQLPPVGAGQPMRQMILEKGASTCYLSDIRRQKNQELLAAVKESVKGDTLETYKVLEKSGDYHEIENQKNRFQAITDEVAKINLTDYILTKGDGSRELQLLVIASSNKDRRLLNKKIRERYIQSGQLEKGHEYIIEIQDGKIVKKSKVNFSAGDRIIFKANDKRVGVMNGTLGQIREIRDKKFVVELDSGEIKEFFIDNYNKIDHAYCVTQYASQGMSVGKAVIDMSTAGSVQNRNALYVDVSRAKYKAVVYTDSKENLEKQTLEFAKKITSNDFSESISRMQNGYRITNNDMYRAPEEVRSYERAEKLAELDKFLNSSAAVRDMKTSLEKRHQQATAEKIVKENAVKASQISTFKPVGNGNFDRKSSIYTR